MKKCERCGASNAERARFCSNCAAAFALGDDSNAAAKTLADSTQAPLPATFVDVAPSNAARVESSDDFYRALASIFTTFGRIAAFLFGRVCAFFKRFGAAVWRSSAPSRTRFFSVALQLGRDAARSFAAVFTPTTRWSESAFPNFLWPSFALFFLWARPCALVAVVYSILSSEARRSGDATAARARAESARNWILLELLCVALKALFEALVMSLPFLKRLFF
jgi:hypothetical protein